MLSSLSMLTSIPLYTSSTATMPMSLPVRLFARALVTAALFVAAVVAAPTTRSTSSIVTGRVTRTAAAVRRWRARAPHSSLHRPTGSSSSFTSSWLSIATRVAVSNSAVFARLADHPRLLQVTLRCEHYSTGHFEVLGHHLSGLVARRSLDPCSLAGRSSPQLPQLRPLLEVLPPAEYPSPLLLAGEERWPWPPRSSSRCSSTSSSRHSAGSSPPRRPSEVSLSPGSMNSTPNVRSAAVSMAARCRLQARQILRNLQCSFSPLIHWTFSP
ncbi:hypothetical protein JG687_00015846 [Phytophthora cactorum]|uniref:Uncharacterized protein n=1 Tax=Phytophthora cactorum TaxID=29920 RepID=A0A8T1TS84_9STRA|nr:hypothetical protein PC120_g20969 [Phytophthora cactorum]KAG4044081.1 hypothetical protein PC123_g20468 [Phytophthora cactorum]KAG6947842.1 hypothetical protein JG687_00015846 [Phytophthora cactorum]